MSPYSSRRVTIYDHYDAIRRWRESREYVRLTEDAETANRTCPRPAILDAYSNNIYARAIEDVSILDLKKEIDTIRDADLILIHCRYISPRRVSVTICSSDRCISDVVEWIHFCEGGSLPTLRRVGKQLWHCHVAPDVISHHKIRARW